MTNGIWHRIPSEGGTQPDLRLTGQGSVWTIEPLTQSGETWLLNKVHYEPWQWLGGVLCIEWRYAGSLMDSAEEDGLTVEWV